MTLTKSDPVGIVGAGAMGLPIVGYLSQAGFPVLCSDLDEGRLADAVAKGAKPARSMKDLAACRALLVFVPTDEDCLAVAEQFAQVASEGAVVVIHSSIRTDTCHKLKDLLEPYGLKVVDAALTGGVRGANEGKINLMVGGTTEDVEHVTPVFLPWTSHVNHLGDLGMGQVGKTVNNLIHWGEVVTIVEALSLGVELGINPDKMRPALANGPADSHALHDLEDMRFTWYEKDIDNAVEMAKEADRTLIYQPLVQQIMRSITVPEVHAMLRGEGVVEFAEPELGYHPLPH